MRMILALPVMFLALSLLKLSVLIGGEEFAKILSDALRNRIGKLA